MRRHAALLAALAVLGVGARAAAEEKQDVVVTVQDPAIIESSGLVARDGQFITINDSGDTGLVFVLDATTGETIGETFWSDTPADVEALAPGPGTEVWVGDIGDNREARATIEATLVDVQPGDRSQAGTTYRFAYPGGAANAESMLVDPQSGRLYFVTKVLLGAQLYAAPERLDPAAVNELRPVGDLANKLATDGAFFPDGRHLVVRGYGSATFYSFPDLAVVGNVDLPDQPQGEGIAVAADSQVYVSSEGKNQPILRVQLPEDLRAQLLGEEPAEPTAPASPARPEAADPEAESGSLLPWLAGGGVLVAAAVGGTVIRSRRRR